MSFITNFLYFPLNSAACVTAPPPQNKSTNVSAFGRFAIIHSAIWFLLPLYGNPYRNDSPSFPGRLPPDRPCKIHQLNISFRENTCLSIIAAVTWRQVALVIKHPTYCGCLLLPHQNHLDTAFSAFRCSSP